MNSTDEDMERALLRYFARDESAARGFQSLTTIFELMHRPTGWRNSFFDQLQGPEEKGALSAILERMVKDGLLERHESEREYEPHYRASDQGLYEEQFGWDALVINDAPDAPAEVAKPQAYDSRTWTGLKAVRIHARNAKVVSSLIDRALDQLPESGEGNEAVMQAAAYLKAARELVDAPNPPSVIIWELVEKAAAIAGLLQLFGMIFSQAIS